MSDNGWDADKGVKESNYSALIFFGFKSGKTCRYPHKRTVLRDISVILEKPYMGAIRVHGVH